jgi:multicomponent Na+:H+ antiporter subunit F
MVFAAILALLVTIALALARAALGPTVFDRLQAANTVGTGAMLILALLGFLGGRPEFLDIALVYGLLNVVGLIAVLKFFLQRSSPKPSDETDSGEARR